MDLKTRYLGLDLRSPLVFGASPLSEDVDIIKRMEDSGAAAVVLHSLFEEQIRRESLDLHHYTTEGTESFAEALTYFPEPEEYQLGPDEYLEHVRKAKTAVSMPVIGSLNGTSVGGWTEYAKKIESAGADALELNVYYIPTDPKLTGGIHTPSDVIKMLMVGAKVTMVVSAVLKRGVGYVTDLEKGVRDWMEEHEYSSVKQMQGSMSQKSVADPAAFERAQYMKALSSYRPIP